MIDTVSPPGSWAREMERREALAALPAAASNAALDERARCLRHLHEQVLRIERSWRRGRLNDAEAMAAQEALRTAAGGIANEFHVEECDA